MIAVIQAGGKGTRLRPYTLVVPKPIMPLGEQPVIEVLLSGVEHRRGDPAGGSGGPHPRCLRAHGWRLALPEAA